MVLGAQSMAQGQAGPPVAIKLSTNDMVVGADGLYTETQHLEIMASTDAAANRLAQQTFNFADSTEELVITDAYPLQISLADD